jgi:hypothetical protein
MATNESMYSVTILRLKPVELDQRPHINQPRVPSWSWISDSSERICQSRLCHWILQRFHLLERKNDSILDDVEA